MEKWNKSRFTCITEQLLQLQQQLSHGGDSLDERVAVIAAHNRSLKHTQTHTCVHTPSHTRRQNQFEMNSLHAIPQHVRCCHGDRTQGGSGRTHWCRLTLWAQTRHFYCLKRWTPTSAVYHRFGSKVWIKNLWWNVERIVCFIVAYSDGCLNGTEWNN